MTRFLRTLALLLPLLPLILWLASSFYAAEFSYMQADPDTDGPTGIECATSAGAFQFACGPRSGTWPLGFDYGAYRLPHPQFWPPYVPTSEDYRFLGFEFDPPDPDSSFFGFQIPYWFPTLLALLISLFIRRKTKPKNAPPAFPIHPTASTAPPTQTAPPV